MVKSTDPTPAQIDDFIRTQYQLWNDQRRDALFALFRDVAPQGFTVEYVGNAPQPGEESLADMFTQYGGKVSTYLTCLLVNGTEAAAYVDNRFVEGDVSVPSIETYRFEGGKLAVRYFHKTA